MSDENRDERQIWTPLLALLLVCGATAMGLAIVLLLVIGGEAATVGIFFLAIGFTTLFAVDSIVFRRASPGANWLERMAGANAIRRRAYRWSAIRAALVRNWR